MSILPGALKSKDPSAVKTAAFDWNSYLAVGVQIAGTPTVVVTGPDAVLTADDVTLANGNRTVNYRLSGGTLGAHYTVTCRIVTDESPAQTDERSIRVLIEDL